MNPRPSFAMKKSLFLLLFATALSIGCQFAPKKVPSGWNWGEQEKPVVPDRILAIWTDTILRQPNQPGVRGFGGRVFFYQKEQNDPIEIDGKLVVFVFDADDQDPENQKPLRKYVIEADDFAKHMSKTSIGPAYSVWLPWGDTKGPTMKLSIIAKYEGREGGTTLSDPTIKLLPGVESKLRKPQGSPSDKLQVESAMAQTTSGVQPANHIERRESEAVVSAVIAEPAKIHQPNRGTQTIELPPSFQRHFQQADPQLGINDEFGQRAPQISRSQVTTEVIDARSQKLGTFKKVYADPKESKQMFSRSSASRLESLRSGKSISKQGSGALGSAEASGSAEGQLNQSP
jgi:hypothetical protein